MSDVKYWNNRRYTAWYDPQFEIDSAYYEHAEPNDPKIRRLVEELAEDIYHVGLRNPLQVVIKEGKTTIHPGKCRAKALKALGRTHAPAIVINYDVILQEDAIPKNCTMITSREQIQGYFGYDCQVEMSHRFLTIKKLRNVA